MAIKRIIIVPPFFSAADIPTLKSSLKRFARMSTVQAWEAEKEGFAEWLYRPASRKDIGIMRRVRVPADRGLSCKVGEVLAVAVQLKQPWAETMLSNIRMARECASASRTNPRDIYDVWSDPYARTEEAA